MVFFNHATRQMTAKIVYYGPGLCGKTTNLNTIYGKTSLKARGEMVSLNTETDRTLFFDLLPMDVGVVGGFKTKLQLYTVPGQVFYNSTRKLVLKGVDGIVFVADSQVPMLDANKESLQNLSVNLKELGLRIQDIPMVFQWNKRDLKNIVSIEELERELNPQNHPSFQSNAQEGMGVFETLRGITKLALTHIKTQHLGETNPAREEQIRTKTGSFVLPATETAAPAPPHARPQTPVSELLGDLQPPAVPAVIRTMPVPAKPSAPVPLLPPKPARTPLAVPGRPQPAPRPTVSPLAVPLAAPAAPRAKSPVPMAGMATLLGDLTHVGASGLSSVIRLELAGELDGSEIEILVQVQQAGKTVAQSQVKRTAPNPGVTSKLSLELKRS